MNKDKINIGVYIELTPNENYGNILLDAFRAHPKVNSLIKLLPSRLKVEANGIETKVTFNEIEVTKENFDLILIRGGLTDIQLGLAFTRHCIREGITVFDNNFLERGYLINKKADNWFFSVNGFTIPKTFILTNKSQLDTTPFTYPLVVKGIGSGRGRKVFKFNDLEELKIFISEKKHKVQDFIYQEFIDYEYDLRIFVLNGEVLGAMRRIPQTGEFRANYSLGGSVEPFQLSQEIKDFAIKATKACNLDICGIDIIIDKQGKPYILEANKMPGMAGISAAMGFNIGERVAEFILKKTGFV